MSETKRIGCRIKVEPSMSGKVELLIWRNCPEGGEGWFPTEREAREHAAKQMRRLANELIEQCRQIEFDERRL